MIIANDATVKGGSFFHETVKKHLRAQEIAEENKLPCIYLVDCGGAFLPEQDRVFPDRDHFGGAFFQQCRMSAAGMPQISAVFGGCTAGGAYIPALSDEVVMVRGTGRIHLGGPPIVKAAIKEVVDGETLGGAEMHSTVSGVSDYLAESELEAIAKMRDIVGALNWPRQAPAERPVRGAGPRPRRDPGHRRNRPQAALRCPRRSSRASSTAANSRSSSRLTVQRSCAALQPIHGEPVGILANNGVLFSESAVKGAHFIELCDQRQTPIIFLQNITGFMVGTDAERGGIAKHSAKLVYAVSNARVPRYTVIIGGSYGAGNYGMCGRGFRPRFLFAWPNARIATMSAEVAANVVTDLRRASLTRGSADETEIGRVDRETRAQFEAQSTPYYATSRLWDDGIIEPDQTRDVLGFCLGLASREIELPGNRPVYRM